MYWSRQKAHSLRRVWREGSTYIVKCVGLVDGLGAARDVSRFMNWTTRRFGIWRQVRKLETLLSRAPFPNNRVTVVIDSLCGFSWLWTSLDLKGCGTHVCLEALCLVTREMVIINLNYSYSTYFTARNIALSHLTLCSVGFPRARNTPLSDLTLCSVVLCSRRPRWILAFVMCWHAFQGPAEARSFPTAADSPHLILRWCVRVVPWAIYMEVQRHETVRENDVPLVCNALRVRCASIRRVVMWNVLFGDGIFVSAAQL